MRLRCAKTAKWIETLFAVETCGSEAHCIRWGLRVPVALRRGGEMGGAKYGNFLSLIRQMACLYNTGIFTRKLIWSLVVFLYHFFIFLLCFYVIPIGE